MEVPTAMTALEIQSQKYELQDEVRKMKRQQRYNKLINNRIDKHIKTCRLSVLSKDYHMENYTNTEHIGFCTDLDRFCARIAKHHTRAAHYDVGDIIQRVADPGANTPKEDEDGNYVNEYAFSCHNPLSISNLVFETHDHMVNKSVEKLKEIADHTVTCSNATKLHIQIGRNPLKDNITKTVSRSLGHFCYGFHLKEICRWIKCISDIDEPKAAIVSWYHPHRKLYIILVMNCVRYEKYKQFMICTTVGMTHQ